MTAAIPTSGETTTTPWTARRAVALALAIALLVGALVGTVSSSTDGPQIIRNAACDKAEAGNDGKDSNGDQVGPSKRDICGGKGEDDSNISGFINASVAIQKPAAIVLLALLPLVMLVGAGMHMLSPTGHGKGLKVMATAAVMAIVVVSIGGIAA